MLVDDCDELLDLLRFAIVELELERMEEAGIIWRYEVDATFGDAVAGIVVAIFDKEFIKVELKLVVKCAVILCPLEFWLASLEIGNGNRFRFVVDFDAVDFAADERVAEEDIFCEEAALGVGAVAMGLFAKGREEAWKFGVTAVMKITFFVFGAVGFVGKFMEELDGVFAR